ncbi:hypothetical protein [Salinarimonas chemoclinalis]|uniref:hypothetical protein n=1 Tax=Salinarimonas chemoclinalis TaxID=3241599 RepID=UPI0035564FF8
MNTKGLRTIAYAIFAIVTLGNTNSAYADETWNDRMTFYSVAHSSSHVAASFRRTPAATGAIGGTGAGAQAGDGRAAHGSDFWWLHREAVRERSSGR